MPRLPDIPLQSWLEDQQKRFVESTAGLLPALDFALGTRAAEAGIPPDYDAPGGRDQWDEAELQQKQEEYRRAQQESEEAARRQQEEEQRQIQAQAQQYQQMQAQAQQEQQQRDEQNRQSVMEQIRSLGIPTPSEAFANFKDPGNASTSTGVFDVGAPPPAAPTNEPASPVDQFNSYASGMMTDAFGAPTPDPARNQDRDNESSTGLLDQIGSAVKAGAENLRRGYEAYQNPTPEQEEIIRRTNPLYDVDRGLRWLIQNKGVASVSNELDEQRRMEEEDAASRSQEPTPREQVLRGLTPEYRAANPDKAARYDEIQQNLDAIVMGASGGLGAGRGGIAHDAVDAIKTLIKHGVGDDIILAMERDLASKSTQTLNEVQRLTRGTESAAARPAAVEPANEPAPVSEAAQPPSPPSPTPYTQGLVTRGLTAEEARQMGLPGFEDVPRPDVRSGEGIRGYGELPRSTSRENGGMTRDQEDIIRAGAEGVDTEVPSLNAAQRRTIASEMLQEEPTIVERLLNEPVDPVRAGAEQEILRENVRTKGDIWENAYHGLQDAQRQWEDALVEAGGDVSKIPEDVSANKAYWANEMGDALTNLSEGIRGTSLRAKAASKIFNAQRGGLEGARMITEAARVEQVADNARRAARGVRRAVQSPDAVVDEETLNQLGSLSSQLQNPRTRRAVSGRGSGGGGGTGAATPPVSSAPREETLAEKLGRLKRLQGQMEDTGNTTGLPPIRQEIEATLQDMREQAQQLAEQRMQARATRGPLTVEEADRIVNETIGRRTQSKIRREAYEEVSGIKAAKAQGEIQKALEDAIQRQVNNEQMLQQSIDRQVQRRIDGMLAQERRADVRAQVKQMAQEAQIWAKRIRNMPEQRPQLQEELDVILGRMREHSNAGERVANDLAERLDVRLQEDAYNRAFQASRQATQATEAAHIDSLVRQIEELRANPRMPDRAMRIGDLLNGLENLGAAGRQRASNIRLRAQTQGVLKSGAFAADVDRAALNTFLMHLDPNKPETMKPILNLMNKPTLWQVLREIPFINMLSNPLTHATNITSTLANGMLRLMLRNPVEQILSGGQLTGTGAAFRGTARGFREGAGQAAQTYLTGLNPRRLENVAARGDVRHAAREALPAYLENTIPEIFGSDIAKRAGGKLGEIMHMASTRPLEAMDAWMGQMAYGGAIDQLAAREANRLIRTGRDELLELGRPTTQGELHQYILDNIHDFPDLIKRAGNIEDYTLFRSNDKGRIEGFLRGLSRLKEGGPDTTVGEKVMGWLADYIMPFTRVPLNFTKQGVGNVAAPVVETARSGLGAARGDREAFAEHGAKAVQGLVLMTIPTMLASDDNLTGQGPSDPGQRQVWELTHKPYSWRWNKNSPWISYEGTPWAIPFSTVAGVKEYYEFKKPEEDVSPEGQLVGAGIGAVRGGIRGALTQSLVEGTLRNVETLVGGGPGEGYNTGVQAAANAISRYTPTGVLAPSGLLNFLAQVTDSVERDAGRPHNIDQAKEVLGNVLESRIPMLRQQLPERRNAYGEVVERPIGKGLLGYQGYLPNEGDVITGRLAEADVGIPRVGHEITVNKGTIPLTIREEQRFQELYGQEYRDLLIANKADEGVITDKELEKIRTVARQRAQATILDEMSDEDFNRRWRRQTPVEVGS